MFQRINSIHFHGIRCFCSLSISYRCRALNRIIKISFDKQKSNQSTGRSDCIEGCLSVVEIFVPNIYGCRRTDARTICSISDETKVECQQNISPRISFWKNIELIVNLCAKRKTRGTQMGRQTMSTKYDILFTFFLCCRSTRIRRRPKQAANQCTFRKMIDHIAFIIKLLMWFFFGWKNVRTKIKREN